MKTKEKKKIQFKTLLSLIKPVEVPDYPPRRRNGKSTVPPELNFLVNAIILSQQSHEIGNKSSVRTKLTQKPI